MKRLAICLLVIGFFLTLPAAAVDEQEVIKQAGQHFQKQEYDKAMQLIDDAIKNGGSTENLFRVKYVILTRTNKLNEALALLDQLLKEKGENFQIIEEKVRLLMRMEKYTDALNTAFYIEKNSQQKSPWLCLEIAKIYTLLKDKDKAFTWLETAVDRGFTSSADLKRDNLFSSLTSDPRFEKIIVKIKEKIGVDKPAKDFTVTLLSGESFQLSKQKGKVVMIDFWATWCGPCKAELPNLKTYYQTFKDKGFEIIGISLDRNENDLTTFLAKDKLPWKISFSGKFWEDPTANLYGIRAIPSYWLIDKKGTLRFYDLRGDAVKKAIEELLAEK